METTDNDAKRRVLLDAGDSCGQFRTACHAKEFVREIYIVDNPQIAAEFAAQLGIDLQYGSLPPEAVNNLTRRIKRVAFGITTWTNYRTRALLYAGRPTWSVLETPR